MIPALLVLGLLASASATRAVPALAASNPVVTENQQPGTSAWQVGSLVTDDATGQIKGYASATSVNQNQSLTLYVTVNPAQTYTIDFYRIGWYAGFGGRLRLHAGPLSGIRQQACVPDATTGLIACNWTPSYSLAIPSDWTSGVYFAVLTNALGYQNYIMFVVRDGRPAPLLYQQSVNTYQAYNNYPDDKLTGKSLYAYNSYGAATVAGDARAVKVSFDRPYTGYGVGDFFKWEIDCIRWLERSGYDVTYSTDVDTHANGGALLNSKGFLSVGHNEYWSKEMFDAVQAARDAGVGLAFLSANGVYRQVRFEPSASGVPNRVVVGYKDARIDPVQGPTTTVEYRIPPVNRPEQALMGLMYCGQPAADCGVDSNVDYVVTNSANWVYAGTGFRDGDRVPGIVGYEMDLYWSSYPRPSFTSWTLLSQSPFVSWGGASMVANSVIYQAPSGAWVFSAGTISWSWGLDNFWYAYADARIQQTTANILNAFLTATPAPAHHFQVTAPVMATAGQAFATTVTAMTAQGSTATGYRGTVHFTSSDAQAVLPADYTFTGADAGVHQFSVTMKTTGNQTLTATDTVTSSITGNQTVTVSAPTATRLGLTGLASATAGIAQTGAVTAYDASGAVANAYRGTVHFTSSDAQAFLPPDYTFTSADAGVHQFSVTLKTAGSQSVTVTDGVATPGSQTVTISPAAASQLSLTGLGNSTAGTGQTATVTVYDSYGNAASGYRGTVGFTSSDAQAVLPANYTFTSGDGGVHQFPVTLKTAGSQTVTATDTVSPGLAGSASVQITAASAVALSLVVPGAARAYQPFLATVTLTDAFGNVATGYRGIVHFSSSDLVAQTAGGMPADYAFTAADAGTHTFSLTLMTVGTQTVTASDTVNPALAASSSITVSL